jgi:hypothetical protein
MKNGMAAKKYFFIPRLVAFMKEGENYYNTVMPEKHYNGQG